VISWGSLILAASQGSDWRFSYSSAAPITLPVWIRADSLRAALSYEAGESVAGFLADLNGDGTDDYVFRFSRATCGTNCEYLLVDGRTRRRLGTVGGSVVVIHSPGINGYPTVHSYGHSSADAGYWSTSVYDGQAYVTVSSVFVEGTSRTWLFESLEKIPYWPPLRRER
jgi:hypothetical protein